jgi:hypothetical protein
VISMHAGVVRSVILRAQSARRISAWRCFGPLRGPKHDNLCVHTVVSDQLVVCMDQDGYNRAKGLAGFGNPPGFGGLLCFDSPSITGWAMILF